MDIDLESLFISGRWNQPSHLDLGTGRVIGHFTLPVELPFGFRGRVVKGPRTGYRFRDPWGDRGENRSHRQEGGCWLGLMGVGSSRVGKNDKSEGGYMGVSELVDFDFHFPPSFRTSTRRIGSHLVIGRRSTRKSWIFSNKNKWLRPD